MGAQLLLPALAEEGRHRHTTAVLEKVRRTCLTSQNSHHALQNALLTLVVPPQTSKMVFVFPPLVSDATCSHFHLP